MMGQNNIIGKRISGYLVTAFIANGSYGPTYQAERGFPVKRKVAFKLLCSIHLDSQAQRDRFLREAESLKILKHPHISPVIDAGIHYGIPYLLIEYAPNSSLRDRLRRLSPHLMVTRDAVNILAPVGQALNYAHELSIIHSNLKKERYYKISSITKRLWLLMSELSNWTPTLQTLTMARAARSMSSNVMTKLLPPLSVPSNLIPNLPPLTSTKARPSKFSNATRRPLPLMSKLSSSTRMMRRHITAKEMLLGSSNAMEKPLQPTNWLLSLHLPMLLPMSTLATRSLNSSGTNKPLQPMKMPLSLPLIWQMPTTARALPCESSGNWRKPSKLTRKLRN